MEIDPERVTDEIKAEVASVRVPPDPPDDFERFWRDVARDLAKTPLRLDVEWQAPKNGVRTGVWKADSLDGRRISGPVTAPVSPSGPQWVFGHGYGAVASGSVWRPGLARAGFIAVGVDARGFGRSRVEGDPEVPGWAVHDIHDRDRYILRGAVADTMRAVDVARALAGADPDRTVLSGGSFSGGTAVLAAPWIAGLRYLAVSVPTFGAYDLRRTMVKRGSGQEINNLFDRLTASERKALRERLRYFDAVNAAAFIRSLPVTIGLGVMDVVVPAETVAAIYHAVPSPDKELLCYVCSHCDHPLNAEWTRFDEHILRRARALCR